VALYLKLLGLLTVLSGLLLGGLTLYAAQDHQSLEQSLAQVNKKYEKIGKEIDTLIDKNLEKITLSQAAELRKAKGIILIVGGVVVGSLLIGMGETLSLLKKISRR
jgi:hypothetical protein